MTIYSSWPGYGIYVSSSCVGSALLTHHQQLNLLAPTAVTTREISLGFGRHVGDIAPQNLGELGFLGQLTAFFSILGALWSKTSFAITMLRITNGWAKYAVWAFMISSNVFMLISAVFTWTWCTPVSKIWLMDMVEGTCWDHRVVVQYNTFSGGEYRVTPIPAE